MCLDDCDGSLTRRQLLAGAAAAVAASACGGSVSAHSTDPTNTTEARIVRAEVRFPNGSQQRTGRLVHPVGAERLPAVLMAQGNPGYLEYLGAMAERIARHGFAVMVVDYFGSFPPIPNGDEARKEWRARTSRAAAWREAATDFDAALAWMRAERIAHASLAAGVGFCGGAVALAHYAARGAALDALVLFYANARLTNSFVSADDPLPDLVDLADQIKVPVQGHYGANDPTAKRDDTRELERRLAAAGAHPAFFYYEGAGHGFMQAGEPLEADRTWGYAPEAAAPAEHRMIEFLEARLTRR